jgi:hypothetical protein
MAELEFCAANCYRLTIIGIILLLHCSTDSGWDNPFRPDGDLSREADEIVNMIKGERQRRPFFLMQIAPLLLADSITTLLRAFIKINLFIVCTCPRPPGASH